MPTESNEAEVATAPSFCFRVRFILGDSVKIDSDASELQLTDSRTGEKAVLRSTEVERPIFGDAKVLSLRGGQHPSEEAARLSGKRWQAALTAAFARLNIGADFGLRAPIGAWTPHGLAWLSEQHGQRVLNDVHGLSVFACEPTPLFVSSGPVMATVGKPEHRFVLALETALRQGTELGDRQLVAYDLYSQSFFQRNADARFVLLVMALETLIDQQEGQKRSAEVLSHIDTLVQLTQDSALPTEQIASLIGGLNSLRKQAPASAREALLSRLGDRRYTDRNENATTFVKWCYGIRHRLVHGGYPRPERNDVDLRAASLELFLGHLICGDLLDLVPEMQADPDHAEASPTPDA